MAADVPRILVVWLETRLNIRTGTHRPKDLLAPEAMPIIVVDELPGPGERVPTLDRCHVDIDVYHPTEDGGHDVAEEVRRLVMFELAKEKFDNGLTTFSRVRTAVKPTRLPYGNPEIHCFGASYRLTVHSRA